MASGKGPSHPTRCPKFHSQTSQGVEGEVTPKSCPLIPTRVPGLCTKARTQNKTVEKNSFLCLCSDIKTLTSEFLLADLGSVTLVSSALPSYR